jgi:hypothetical protein
MRIFGDILQPLPGQILCVLFDQFHQGLRNHLFLLEYFHRYFFTAKNAKNAEMKSRLKAKIWNAKIKFIEAV